MRKSRLFQVGQNELTMRLAQREVAYYLKAKGEKWSHLHNHYRHVTYLMEEVGELARAVINLERSAKDPGRRGLNRSHKARLDRIKDALGDILYQLLGLSVAYEIDLQDAFEDSMQSIQKRYAIPR